MAHARARSQVLITLLGSCALFRTLPPSHVLDCVARNLGARLHTCNAADLASALAALARLRFLPVCVCVFCVFALPAHISRFLLRFLPVKVRVRVQACVAK